MTHEFRANVQTGLLDPFNPFQGQGGLGAQSFNTDLQSESQTGEQSFFSRFSSFTEDILKDSVQSIAKAGTTKLIESEIIGKTPIKAQADIAKSSDLNLDTGAVIGQGKLPLSRTGDLEVIDGPTPIIPNQKRIDQRGMGNFIALLTSPLVLGLGAGLIVLMAIRKKK